jgi:uncharacterized protein
MIDERILARFKEQKGFDLAPHLMVLARVGSHSHGTYIAPTDPNAIDDVDYLGIMVPPVDHLIGLPRLECWNEKWEELDVVIYSLDKAIRLLMKNNPNVLGILWMRDEDYVHRTFAFDHLRANRDIFTSQSIITSFIGYASGQLKKMESFDLTAMDKYAQLKTEVDGYVARNENVPKELSQRYDQFKSKFFSGYMGEKRKRLVQEFGFDVKNAAHLIRLLRMGIEFAATGQLNVYRAQDAEELIAIKQGKWTLEQVKVEAERLFAKFRALEETTVLPEQPDYHRVNNLLVGLTLGYIISNPFEIT